MIRVACISDTHSILPKVEPCDILLLGGDICDNGSAVAQVGWLYDVFKPWLEKVPAKHIVGIAGNHDLVFGKNSELVPRGLKWHYLQGTIIEIEGLKIYGLPWSLPIWGAFQLDEEGLKRKCSQIPDDIDIIVSHGPPYGIGDGVPRLITDQNEHEWHSVEHVGSFALRERVFDIRPLLTVFSNIFLIFLTAAGFETKAASLVGHPHFFFASGVHALGSSGICFQIPIGISDSQSLKFIIYL